MTPANLRTGIEDAERTLGSNFNRHGAGGGAVACGTFPAVRKRDDGAWKLPRDSRNSNTSEEG